MSEKIPRLSELEQLASVFNGFAEMAGSEDRPLLKMTLDAETEMWTQDDPGGMMAHGPDELERRLADLQTRDQSNITDRQRAIIYLLRGATKENAMTMDLDLTAQRSTYQLPDGHEFYISVTMGAEGSGTWQCWMHVGKHVRQKYFFPSLDDANMSGLCEALRLLGTDLHDVAAVTVSSGKKRLFECRLAEKVCRKGWFNPAPHRR